MPTYLDPYFDLRIHRLGWSWSDYVRGKITLLSKGRTDTKREAEDTARSCNSRCQAEESDRRVAALSAAPGSGEGG